MARFVNMFMVLLGVRLVDLDYIIMTRIDYKSVVLSQ